MSNSPPPSNPVLTAYESFQSNTPLVTRYMLTTLTISYLLTYFCDPGYAASNIPLFTIQRFELYRILTSHLVCSNLLSLVFAFLSFTDNAKRLEFSIGSTAFLTLAFTLGTLTNVVFILFTEACYFLTNSQTWLLQSSDGIWNILFGLIAIECAHAPPDSKRRLFFVDVPTLYYPCGLLALFSLMAGMRLSWCFSVGIGYVYAYGYCDRFKVSSTTFRSWEDGWLRNFTTRSGWVVGHAASGAEAWTNLPTSSSSSGGGTTSSLFDMSAFTGGAGGGAGGAGGGNTRNEPSSSSSSSNNHNKKKEPKATPKEMGFPKSGGRTLGNVSSRSNAVDARAARLMALEQRNAENQTNDDNEVAP